MADYTVKQLSKLAGVSVRTLHYYDEIGLLKPSRVGGNGYRFYEAEAVLRLQQILFYKELGLSLDEIGEILERPDFDVLRALEEHRRALQQRLGRLRRLMQTVDVTIAHLKGERAMDAKALFAGFSDEQQAKYEAEAAQKWGEPVRESSRRWKAYSPERRAAILAEGGEIYAALTERLDESPDSEPVQALIGRWHEHLRNFYEPDVPMLRGLGEAYVAEPSLNAFFNRIDPQLAAFMREAIEIYCDRLRPTA